MATQNKLIDIKQKQLKKNPNYYGSQKEEAKQTSKIKVDKKNKKTFIQIVKSFISKK